MHNHRTELITTFHPARSGALRAPSMHLVCTCGARSATTTVAGFLADWPNSHQQPTDVGVTQ